MGLIGLVPVVIDVLAAGRSPGNIPGLPRQVIFGRVRMIRDLSPVQDEALASALCSR